MADEFDLDGVEGCFGLGFDYDFAVDSVASGELIGIAFQVNFDLGFRAIAGWRMLRMFAMREY